MKTAKSRGDGHSHGFFFFTLHWSIGVLDENHSDQKAVMKMMLTYKFNELCIVPGHFRHGSIPVQLTCQERTLRCETCMFAFVKCVFIVRVRGVIIIIKKEQGLVSLLLIGLHKETNWSVALSAANIGFCHMVTT